MTPDRWIVTALGLALIAFIVWFFWLKRTRGTAASPSAASLRDLSPSASCPSAAVLSAERWEMAGMTGVLGRHTSRLPSLAEGHDRVSVARHTLRSCGESVLTWCSPPRT